MLCIKCGQQLSENAVFCSKCGAQIRQNIHTLSEPVQEELIIKEGLCNRVKSLFFVEDGYGVLTNSRFIYLKKKFVEVLTGRLLKNRIKEYDLEIPINQISRIKDGRQGIAKTIIICTKSGEDYNFYFTHRQTWISEFIYLINKQP